MNDNARIALTVPRATHFLGMVRKVVAAAAERSGFGPSDVDMIELAIDEACSNAVLHGGPGSPDSIGVEVEITEGAFVMTLVDGGPPYAFEECGNFVLADKLAEDGHGGLGIYIMKTFMDEVSYRYTPAQGSVLRLSKLRALEVEA